MAILQVRALRLQYATSDGAFLLYRTAAGVQGERLATIQGGLPFSDESSLNVPDASVDEQEAYDLVHDWYVKGQHALRDEVLISPPTPRDVTFPCKECGNALTVNVPGEEAILMLTTCGHWLQVLFRFQLPAVHGRTR